MPSLALTRLPDSTGRLFTMAIACCLLILSSFFASIAADHDCTGSGCQICAVVNAHEHLSDAISPEPVFLVHAVGREITTRILPASPSNTPTTATLVSLKIKLTI